jgi:hypothetical protein
MIAFVRGVIARSIAAGAIVKVSGSMSTNTGVAPAYTIAAAVATKVNGTVITSSPAPMPAASSARCSALVPEFTPIASAVPAVGGELALEGRDLLPEDELRAVEHTQDARVDFRFDRTVLTAEICVRNHPAALPEYPRPAVVCIDADRRFEQPYHAKAASPSLCGPRPACHTVDEMFRFAPAAPRAPRASAPTCRPSVADEHLKDVLRTWVHEMPLS